MQFHFFLVGLLLGWGAAIPIGPINLEVIRRNLFINSRSGIFFGFGACSADLTYLLLLSAGLLLFLNHGIILQVISVAGACVLFWFAYQILRAPASNNQTHSAIAEPLYWQYIHGYLLTLLNPFTILFWSSISAQIVALASKGSVAVWLLGGGVLAGTMSWILSLNTVLHYTRHRLEPRTINVINKVGGIILLIFAVFSFLHNLRFITQL